MIAAHRGTSEKVVPGQRSSLGKKRIHMKYSVSQKEIEQRTLRTKAGRTSLFQTFRPAAFVAALFVFVGMAASQGNAQTDGIMVLQNMTTPRGGVWLSNSTPDSQGQVQRIALSAPPIPGGERHRRQARPAGTLPRQTSRRRLGFPSSLLTRSGGA